VLSGRVHLQLGERLYELEQGDSIDYRSSIPQRVSNAGEEVAEVIWVISPPVTWKIQTPGESASPRPGRMTRSRPTAGSTTSWATIAIGKTEPAARIPTGAPSGRSGTAPASRSAKAGGVSAGRFSSAP